VGVSDLKSPLPAADPGAVTARRLTLKKTSFEHGEWMAWLEHNEEALGFGVYMARRLLQVYTLCVNAQSGYQQLQF
jgi:hypothetical protein